MKIRSYAPIFALLGMFFAAMAYGSTGGKEILGADERAWLTQNQSRLVLAVETGYAPFVFIDSKDQPTGLAHDYLRLIESKLDVRFKQRRFSSLNDIFEKVRSGEIHIVNAVTNTPERARFLAMTDSFVSVPNVIVVTKDRLGQMREKDLSGLKVSLVKSYAVTEHLANNNPGFSPNLVPDDLTALLNVSFGQSDAAVIDLATASYLISQKGIANLRVAGEVAFDIRLAIGSPVNEPVLHGILKKGLGAITDEEKQGIHKRWISASSQSIFTDRRFWVVAGGVLFVVLAVIAVILVWNRALRQQVALRTEALAREREYIAERKQLEQELSRRLHHRDVMERITRISFESADVEELLGKVLDEILAGFDADRAWFLYPCDPDAPSWSVPMERTRPEWPGASARGAAIPMTSEVADVFREVLASAKPLPYGPAAPRGIPAAVGEQFSIRSQIQMALHPRMGSPWAMGLHHCAQARAYDEDDLLLFNDIGQRVADALSSMIMLKNLRESEKKFRTLFEEMVSGFALHEIVFDENGKPVDYITLEANREFERLLDTKRENVIGKKAYETIPGLDKKWLDIFGKVALTGESSSYEEYASNLDKWFAGTVFSPQKGMVAGTFIDITERKRAEQALAESESRFREIFNTVSDAIFIHDAETGRIVDVNRRMCEMYGITREEAFACGPDDLSAGVPPYSSAEAIEKIHLARIVGPQTFDWLARARDGHLFWVEVSLQFALIGSQQRILAVVRDITERREFMEELKRSNTDLEQFSYAVSHDMRQPLRMISSYLQLLELKLAGQLDGEKRDYFNFAIEGAKRIDQMLVELLEYSRIGRIGEPQAWVESRAVLDEALKFLQPALAEARADLNITGDWPNIFARHDEILRLFQNLIGNAAKFRVAGRIPEITVTSVVVKNEWHLCVADNGVGIATDQIKRLFQVFHRLQSREAYEGTGIGLALCRKIAEHHKGRIWAESAGEGQGSKFYVVLPMMHEKATS